MQNENTNTTTTTAQAEASLRFVGFYESMLEHEFDSAVEYTIENMVAENGGDESAIYNANQDAIALAFAEYQQGAARETLRLFNEYIFDTYGVDIKLQFVKIDSPKFYNFRTDMIDCTYDVDALKSILFSDHSADARWNEFADFIEEVLKPRSGFIPYYSNRIKDWGEFDQWEETQRALLIEWACKEVNWIYTRYGEGESGYTDDYLERLQNVAHSVIPDLCGGAQ